MSLALCNLRNYRRSGCKTRFRILMPVHDAIIFECTPENVRPLVEDVIPKCMVDQVVIPGIPELKYTVDRPDIELRWGEHTPKEVLVDMGVPEDLL